MSPSIHRAGVADINALEVPDEGDPERARELLAEAGYPDGLPIRLLYRETQPYPDIATTREQDLPEAGFEAEPVVPAELRWLNEEVNEAIDAALVAPTPEEANQLWAQADELATTDPAWVPMANAKTPTVHSERLGGFVYHFPSPHNGDPMNAWIEE